MCADCDQRVRKILNLVDHLPSQEEMEKAETARKKELADLRAKAKYHYSKLEPTAEELHWFQTFIDNPSRVSPMMALVELRVQADPDKPFLIGEPDFAHLPISQFNAEVAACIDAFQWYVDVAASQKDSPVYQEDKPSSSFKIFELFPKNRPHHTPDKPTDKDTDTTHA